MGQFRLVNSPHVEDLGGGLVALPGGVVELSDKQLKQPPIKQLIDAGRLIPAAEDTTNKEEDDQ